MLKILLVLKSDIYADVYANNNVHDGAIIAKSCGSSY